MAASFDEGYRRPYDRLVREAPGDDVYPQAAFRTEWGPIFHRGRLDGSARRARPRAGSGDPRDDLSAHPGR